MLKKMIISTFAAISLMVVMQAPASAAMSVAKPATAVQSEAAAGIVKVGGRRGGFRIRFGHGRRWHGRHYWHGRGYWYKKYHYRKCHWHHGYKHCHWRKRFRHHH